MKKLLLLSIGATLSMSVFAQSARTVGGFKPQEAYFVPHYSNNERTTATYDTTIWEDADILVDSNTLYYAGSLASDDSGWLFGINAYGDEGFAERYDFDGADSSVQVVGVEALFAGTFNSSSTKMANFKLWNVGAQTTTSDPNIFYSGFPNAVLDSVLVPITNLGIGVGAGAGVDTFDIQIFATPSTFLTSSFFVGYTIGYDYTNFGGDTIALQSSYNGYRNSVVYNTSGSDTIINDQVLTQTVDGSWNDNTVLYQGELENDYYIYPIVIVQHPEGVNGVTRNNLTFFGNYPNPASDQTNIKFSLANNTDVTITITDMAGHTINTLNETNLAAGMNIISVNTSAMASGDYLYLVRTAGGAGMVGKMTIIK